MTITDVWNIKCFIHIYSFIRSFKDKIWPLYGWNPFSIAIFYLPKIVAIMNAALLIQYTL